MSESIWAGVVGHATVLSRLAQEAAHDSVAAAYLFAGPNGVGKTTVALGFTQRLACTGDAPPCGACELCRRVAHRVPNVVRIVRPELQAGQGVFKAQLHRAERIRELQADTSLRGFENSVRVYVIQSAEALTEVAANGLLKTLEEPPPGVIFILTSEQPAMLLPTVLSRVRRLDFGTVPTPAIAAWLETRHAVEHDLALICAGSAAGRPAKALRLATEPAAREFRAEVLDQIGRLGEVPPVAALRVAERWLGGQTDEPDESAEPREAPIEVALDLLEWWYRDALVVCATQSTEGLINRDRVDAVVAFAQHWGPAALRAGLAALQQARRSLLRNANGPLAVETLWLRLARGGRPAGRGVD